MWLKLARTTRLHRIPMAKFAKLYILFSKLEVLRILFPAMFRTPNAFIDRLSYCRPNKTEQ